MKLNNLTISPDKKTLELSWDDGSQARFHAFWLRDNSLDDETRSPENGQRLISVLDIPEMTTIAGATITAEDTLCLTMAPEMKAAVYSGKWLKRHAYDTARTRISGDLDPQVEIWDAHLQARIPTGHWDQISKSSQALGQWLSSIRRHGFAVLNGVSTASGALCQVAELFGFVRETNYGRWFDVRTEVNPSNLAYTNMGLQAHTDNPYRNPVPTLQLLSCLENSVAGGDSIVVDGFRAALRLKSENPEAFDLLTRYRVAFEYSGSQGVRLRSYKTMIELAADGELVSISFNNRSVAPITQIPFADIESFYAAYRRFAELIEDTDMQVTFKLSPGQLFIVDNTRILHARKSFSGSGRRWLQGCYADKDALLSALAIIEEQQNLGVAV